MRLKELTSRLILLVILHAVGVGHASPSVLVTRPADEVKVEWLPRDNQTLYRLTAGEVKRLELNTSSVSDVPVYMTVSPCTKDVHWAVYRGKTGDGHLSFVKGYSGVDVHTFFAIVASDERYVIQLSSSTDGMAAISVRGEHAKPGRLRLRARTRRKLSANWDASSIDPQTTIYFIVASQKKNYTSLCAAQYDLNINRMGNRTVKYSDSSRSSHDKNDSHDSSMEFDNKIIMETEEIFNAYDVSRNAVRRRKFGRSTKVSEEDPLIINVGDRTHHLIENVVPSATYHVSVFAIGRDRQAGVLLASASIHPRSSSAKRLRENVPLKTELRGRLVFYYKASTTDGLWLATSTCGGPIDVEVLVKGKRIYSARDIETYKSFYVPAPLTTSIQETSDEGSIQFDSSSSEEARMRYIIKVSPSTRDSRNEISLEITASNTRWGINTPELGSGEGATVRELRPRKSCRSVDIAFLPASHHAVAVIRYCITARESSNGENIISCQVPRKGPIKTQCIHHSQKLSDKVIVQKVIGLKPGKKYAIQVTASSKGSSIPYKILYVDTSESCKN